MKYLRIGNTVLQVKDYECSEDGLYLPKPSVSLWLYVNITNACNATCPFCVNPAKRSHQSIAVSSFATVLACIEPFVSGVSITGGEPMMDVGLLSETVAVIDDRLDESKQLDLVTNGINIEQLPNVHGLERFTTIHVSRHATKDDVNRTLMGWPTAPSVSKLADAINSLPDPNGVVLNCVLQRGGVCDHASVTEYLEMAAGIGVKNVSFIGMIRANSYCIQNSVSLSALELEKDERFSIWNHFHDHEYCQCMAGDYRAEKGFIRFYHRASGSKSSSPYCRQLVYGSDDTLRQGFGDAPMVAL